MQLPRFPEAANVVGEGGDDLQGEKGKTGDTGEQREKVETANGGALEMGRQACYSSNPAHAILIQQLLPPIYHRFPRPPPSSALTAKTKRLEHFCVKHVAQTLRVRTFLREPC